MTKPNSTTPQRNLDRPWTTFLFGGPLNIAMIGYMFFMSTPGNRGDLVTPIWLLFVPTVILAGITVWRLQRLPGFGGRRILAEVLLAWIIVTAISPFLLEGPEFLFALVGQGSFSAGMRGVIRIYNEPDFFYIVPTLSAILGTPSAIVLTVACFATSENSTVVVEEIG